MKITADWHLHTTHSCDCGPGRENAGLEMSALCEKLAAKGVADFGVTDHVFSPYNLVDIFESRKEFDSLPFNRCAHFGVEASSVSQWELDEIETGRQAARRFGLRKDGPAGAACALSLAEEDIKNYGIEYVVAGVHFPLYVELTRENVIKDYHRQLLFLASHKLVDIVAHPWWWGGFAWKNEQGRCLSDPWLDDFGKIPMKLHDEFAACAKQHGKAVEVNVESCLCNPAYPDDFGKQYADYIAYLAERGVKLAVASDSHGPDYAPNFAEAERTLSAAGVKEKDLWTLAPREKPTETKDEG